MQDSIEYHQNLPPDVRQTAGVFAEEYRVEGARSFFVCDRAVFSESAVEPNAHFHEVLIGPCWMYFDVDVAPLSAATAIDLDNVFLGQLAASLQHLLGAANDMRYTYISDASHDKKYSRHIVVKRLLNGVWTAYHTNSAMKYVAEDVHARLQAVTALSAIDLGVYRRHQCFRALFSSKFGQRRPLLPLWHTAAKEQLLQSLITNVPLDVQLLSSDSKLCCDKDDLPMLEDGGRSPRPRHVEKEVGRKHATL